MINHDDILGDGVNVAARLESMAEPGGICIASSVYDQITGKLDLGFQDIGQQNLRNISRPIRVYRVSGTVPPVLVPPVARPTAALPVPATRSPLQWVVGSLIVLAAVVFTAVQVGWVQFGAATPAVVALVAPSVAPVPSALPKSTPPNPVTVLAPLPEPVSPRILSDAKPLKRPADPRPAQANATPRVPVAAPTSAPPELPAVAPVATAANVARFNGRWSVHVDCAKHDDGALDYKMDFMAEVKDGWLRGEVGKPDNPGWLLLQGDIQADGRSVLQAKGLTADPRLSVKGVRQGTPYAYQVDARFNGDQGTGRRVQLRACLLNFSRQ